MYCMTHSLLSIELCKSPLTLPPPPVHHVCLACSLTSTSAMGEQARMCVIQMDIPLAAALACSILNVGSSLTEGNAMAQLGRGKISTSSACPAHNGMLCYQTLSDNQPPQTTTASRDKTMTVAKRCRQPSQRRTHCIPLPWILPPKQLPRICMFGLDQTEDSRPT